MVFVGGARWLGCERRARLIVRDDLTAAGLTFVALNKVPQYVLVLITSRYGSCNKCGSV